MLINLVSKIYPSGIQLRNLSNVSNVACTSGAFWEFSCNKNIPINNYLLIIVTLKSEIKSTYHYKLTQLKNLWELIAHAKKKSDQFRRQIEINTVIIYTLTNIKHFSNLVIKNLSYFYLNTYTNNFIKSYKVIKYYVILEVWFCIILPLF